MAREYYLALYNEKTWDEFRESGKKIYGTTKTKETRAKKLQVGDCLICYISKWSVFAGLIEITSPSFLDSSDIWGGDNFPVRFKVKPLATFDPQYGIPVGEYFDKLSIFSHLKRPNAWAGFFLNALNHFPVEDGEKIAEGLLSPEKFSCTDQEES